MKPAVFVFLLLLMILHQDYWWRADDRTLIFDFLPVSLAYHMAMSIVASVFWGLVCRYAWPPELDAADAAPAVNSPPEVGH